MCRCMFHTGYISNLSVAFSKDQLDGACSDPRSPDAMSLELSLENYEGEYKTDAAVNRLEAYEGLLLDEKSALWRELQARKARRTAQPAPAAGENALAAKETVFDVESDEETPTLPLPKLDPGRDVGERAA